MSLIEILIVLSPVFLLIAGGFAAARFGLFREDHVTGVMYFAQNFAIPVLLFGAVARMDLQTYFDPQLLMSFYGGAFCSFILGIVGARYVFRRTPGESVAIGFAALFSNSLLLGIPITERALGADALGSNFAIISIHSPFCYLVGITFMEFARADGESLANTLKLVGRAILRNALMLGLGLGFIVNLSGLELPEPFWAAADMFARAALPAALFGLGAILTRYRLSQSFGETSMVVTLSLIVHPIIVLLLGRYVFHLDDGPLYSAMITSSMAPGINAFVFASLYQRAIGVAASSVLLGTAISVLTVSVWLRFLHI